MPAVSFFLKKCLGPDLLAVLQGSAPAWHPQ